MKIIISMIFSFILVYAIMPAKYANYMDVSELEEIIDDAKEKPIDSRRWAFIIAIEEYENAEEVAYAKSSGEMFELLANKVLGVSERNTYVLIDEKATSARIVDQLDQLVQNVEEGDTIFFYYSGHGVPIPYQNNEPYILPIDKSISNLSHSKELKLSNIYKKLASSKASHIVAFVDSCFSGATDNVSVFKGVAAPRLVAKNVVVDRSKMSVITAGSGKQFSNMYKEKKSRLFSYFLIKGIAEEEYRDLDSLYDYVRYNVAKTSKSFGDLYKQVPTIDGNSNLKF